MNLSTPAQQNYNAGIIFLSYVIAVIGAFTTLELLQRRTHIRGYYNWFLLFAAAASMGGVGIWSMHFIGNNSLTITLENGEKHQLLYATGFTFASLIVAIVSMFLAFAFVGITEEARVRRIVPSGIIAGFGIVSMHYLGQVAVDFFIMRNKLAFVVSASVIAVCAVTVALFIFFKLREKWANQWYKRLGCAMLMGIAVCGMHYTALAGTMYYPGKSDSGPPTPLLGTPALIGIIAAVVVSACILLFFIGAKNQLENNSSLFQSNKSHKRLILDTIFFDTNGRILVKVDGVVPMKEIWNETLGDEVNEALTTSHPLFTKLFETTIQWSNNSKSKNDKMITANGSDDQLASQSEGLGSVEKAFLTAAQELVSELRLATLSDLGHLFDSVLLTNIIPRKKIFSKDSKKAGIDRSASTRSSPYFLSTPRLYHKRSATSVNEFILPKSFKRERNTIDETILMSRSPSIVSHPDNSTVIDIFNNSADLSLATTSKLSVRDSDDEDRHIFLVRKIESNKDLVNLLSVGFRFAEPAFISKTMGDKLRVPAEYMLNYFKDMLLMTETAAEMYTTIRPSSDTFYTSPVQQRQMQNESVRGGVFVGLFTLIEDQQDGDMPYLVVQKDKRYAFPMVQLLMDGDTEVEKRPIELTRSEKSTILSLRATATGF